MKKNRFKLILDIILGVIIALFFAVAIATVANAQGKDFDQEFEYLCKEAVLPDTDQALDYIKTGRDSVEFKFFKYFFCSLNGLVKLPPKNGGTPAKRAEWLSQNFYLIVNKNKMKNGNIQRN